MNYTLYEAYYERGPRVRRVVRAVVSWLRTLDGFDPAAYFPKGKKTVTPIGEITVEGIGYAAGELLADVAERDWFQLIDDSWDNCLPLRPPTTAPVCDAEEALPDPGITFGRIDKDPPKPDGDHA